MKKKMKKMLAVICALSLSITVIAVEPKNINASTMGSTSNSINVQKTVQKGRRVVGYLPSYRAEVANSIDFSALTHCCLSFMTYNNGTLTSGFSDGDVRNIVNKCHENGVEALIAIGGGGGFVTNGNPFDTVEKRHSFVNQIMNYVNQYNLDGVDIDIEVDDYSVWSNYDELCSELSARLKESGKLLTMAVNPWFTNSIKDSTYNYFDFLNLMTYDASFGDGEVAPWSLIYSTIAYYKNRGVSDDRLVIGVPFYGYASGAIAYTYAQILAMDASNSTKDYANGIYYNGENTIREKAEYSKNYGGTMIWEIGQDSFGDKSLLKTIKNVMETKDDNPAEVPTETPTEAPTQMPTEPEITTTGDGMTICQNKEVILGDWGYNIWDGTYAKYSGGESLEQFQIKIIDNKKQNWGTHVFTKGIPVTNGKTYNISVNVDSNVVTPAILMKEDISGTELSNQGLIAGRNTWQGTFTANSGTMKLVFNLQNVDSGTMLNFSNVTVTEVSGDQEVTKETTNSQITTKETTLSQENTSDSESTTGSTTSGALIEIKGGAENTYFYDKDTMVNVREVVNIQQAGSATEPGIYMNVPAGISEVKVNGEVLDSSAIQGAGTWIYLSKLTKRKNYVEITYAEGVAKITIINMHAPEENQVTTGRVETTPKVEEPVTTPKAEEPTTTPKAEELVTTPKAEEPATTPKADEPATTPKAEEETTTPKAEEPTTTPKAEENTTTPKAEEPVTTPKAEEPATTAKNNTTTVGGQAKTGVAAPAQVKLAKKITKKNAAKKIKISFKKVTGSKGYEVRISTSKKFNKIIAKKTCNKVKFTIKNKKLAKKKKLYIQVRAYALDGKTKVYGKWSKILKVKIK